MDREAGKGLRGMRVRVRRVPAGANARYRHIIRIAVTDQRVMAQVAMRLAYIDGFDGRYFIKRKRQRYGLSEIPSGSLFLPVRFLALMRAEDCFSQPD